MNPNKSNQSKRSAQSGAPSVSRPLQAALTLGYGLCWGLVCVYLTLRVSRWLSLLLHRPCVLPTALVFLAFCAMSMAMGKTYMVGRHRWSTYLCGVSTFLVLYLSMSVVLSDLIRLVLGLAGADQTRAFRVLGWGCLLFTLGAACAGFCHAQRIKLVNHSLVCSGLTEPRRLVLLSDLHIGYYVGVRHIQKVVEQVNRLLPDLVVISGDIINAGNTRECPELDQVARLLSQLQAREGVFAVVGNHDPDVSDPDFQQFLNDAHITLLEDQVWSDGRLQLVGRTTRTKPRKELDQLTADLDPRLPVAVVDHDPLGSRDVVAAGLQLVLCGHTHKGQVLPLERFVRVLYSRAELWGCTKLKDTYVVVTAGTGYFSMPMRLGSSCEVVCLDLTPGP